MMHKIFSLFLILFLTACGMHSPKHKINTKSLENAKKSSTYVGHFKTGNPYVINKQKYFPMKSVSHYEKTGTASWYGLKDGFHGKKTANGDVFDCYAYTAAHKTLPLPCIVEVTNLDNNKSLLVMVQDRGPFVHDRLIDLSENAAEALDFRHRGTANVKVKYVASETNKLLEKLALEPVHGYIPQEKMKLGANHSIKSYMVSLNKKYNNDITKNFKPYQNNTTNNITLAKATQSFSKPNPSKKEALLAKYNLIKGANPKISLNKSYVILIGGFTEEHKALEAYAKVKDYGQTQLVKLNNTYKIKVGPIDTMSKAQQMSIKLGKVTNSRNLLIKTL